MLVVVAVISFGNPSIACEFFFNYPEIDAPLGTIGVIAVRVLKDHSDCTLKGMDGFVLEWENLQLLEETEWKEVGIELYEKRVRVLLSEQGPGHFLIWKDCTREGYDEKYLPVTIGAGNDAWESAFHGTFPYATDFDIQSVTGRVTVVAGGILTGDQFFSLLAIPKSLADVEDKITVYYTTVEGKDRPLLLVSQTLFYRFDI